MDESPADCWSTLHRQTTISHKIVICRFTRPPHKSPWPPGDPKPETSCCEVPLQHYAICPNFPKFTTDKHETIIKPALWLVSSTRWTQQRVKPSDTFNRSNIILETCFRLQQAVTLSRNNVHRLFLQMLGTGTSHRWPFLQEKRCSRSRNRRWMFNGPYSQY